MHLVYFSSSTIPSQTANSIHVMKMCQAFARNGHSVTLIARKPKAPFPTKDVFAFYGVDACFKIIRVPRRGVRGGGLYPVRAIRHMLKEKPDLIYGRDATSCLMATLFNRPIVFESHAPKFFSNTFLASLYNHLLNSWRVKKIVVITRALEDYYKRHYPRSSHKLFVSPDGADPFPNNVCASKIQNNVGAFKVGYVGSIFPGKGMEIIEQLAPLCPEMSFHVVGGNDAQVKSWKKNCSDIKNLFFYGFVEPHLVPSYIKAFDVLLLPNQMVVHAAPSPGIKSVSDIGKWTSPLKLFEYMAAGKPIVASDLAVVREVLWNKKNSLLVPPTDVKAWKNALYALQKEKALAHRIGQAAKETFLANYTWQKRAELVLEGLGL